MKLRSFGKPIGKEASAWNKVTRCTGFPSPIGGNGCNSEVELSISDIYIETARTANGIQIAWHWMCPLCHLENLIAPDELPADGSYLEKPKWLRRKYMSLLHDLQQLGVATPAEQAELVKILTPVPTDI